MAKKENATVKPKKKKWRAAKIATLIVLLLFVVVAAVIYVGGALHYSDKFFNGTRINGVSCANKTIDEVKEILQERVEDYELTIKFMDAEDGRAVVETITGKDLGIKYTDDGGVDDLLEAQNPWKWIISFTQIDKFEVDTTYTYKENMIDVLLWDMEYYREENQVQSQDAYLKDCGTYYEIVPEVMGNALDSEKVKALVVSAIEEGTTEVDLVASECYKVPAVYQDDETLNSDMNQLNLLLKTNITYDFDDRTEVVDAAVVREWIYKDADGIWQVNEDKAGEYVQELKNKYDTFGRKRQFKTSLGKTVTLKGGDYGWAMKKQSTVNELIAAIKEGKQATMEPVYLYKGKSRATNDLGGTYVEISIDDQRMWCYKDGKLIVDTPVVTGDMSKEDRATPKGGVWAIDAKQTDRILRGEGYASHVDFWMPFNGGVGIHDASWRSKFGGEIYLTNGSHGCINTPFENAKKIYEAVSIGTAVVVY